MICCFLLPKVLVALFDIGLHRVLHHFYTEATGFFASKVIAPKAAASNGRTCWPRNMAGLVMKITFSISQSAELAPSELATGLMATDVKVGGSSESGTSLDELFTDNKFSTMILLMDRVKETLNSTCIHVLRPSDCLTNLQNFLRRFLTSEVITSAVWIPACFDWGGNLGAAGFLDDLDLLSTARSFLPLMDILSRSGQLLRRALTVGPPLRTASERNKFGQS
jgi:hypothetical protein